MSVVDGQNANASTFNSAFASKSSDNTLTGKQTLNRPGSGASVVDAQQAINDVIASDALKIPLTQKAAANGVATLDASTLVPVAQVPDLTASKITDFSTAADARITLQKGAASGIAPLDGSSKIDASYLPSYVDDVVEVANYAALPVTGETGKIYVTLDTNNTYRWSGSVYVKIGQPIASTDDVPEGAINQYFTPARVADKQIGIQFQDQGSNLGTTATVDTIDFIGAGITATRASNKVTVEVTATGGGGGSKNYFSQSSINPDFETGTVSPWQAMTTTWSGSAPVNAPTAGAVVTSFYTNIVNPLAGTTSATMTKGSGNGQYEGVMSGVFTIDREDLAKVLYGSFAYEVAGTVASDFDVSGTSTQSLEIWLYNVNANQWIQPAGFRGINQFTGSGKVTFSFQTDATAANNQYRICLIVRQNTAGAWNLKVDDFLVGPQAIVLGTPVTDWIDYTLNVGATTTPPTKGTVVINKAKYRRIGDSMEIQYEYEQSAGGSVGSGTYLFPLPSGFAIDTNKQGVSTTGRYKVGSGMFSTSAFPDRLAGVFAYNANNLVIYYDNQAAGPSVLVGSSTSMFNGASVTNLKALVPIVGWSSNVQTSSDTDTRVVDFIGTYAASQSVTANVTNFSISSVVKDTHGAFSSTTYTVPVSGDYLVSCSFLSNTAASTATLYKNGVNTGYVGASVGSANYAGGGSMLVTCNAGDTLTIRSTQSATISSFYLSIHRLSGPSVITATESISASYNISAAASTADVTQFNFDNKQWDSHNAVTTGAGAWKFTAPVSGTYSVSATLYCGGSNTFVGLYKQGSIYRTFSYPLGGTATGAVGTGSTLVQLNAGQYIDVRNITGSARTPATSTGTGSTLANSNYITITRVGN